LVADGNFKADHVRQKSDDDKYLSEGGGMMPTREEYREFLRTAIEKSTVSLQYTVRDIGNDVAGHNILYIN
jgi:hypothetical protein